MGAVACIAISAGLVLVTGLPWRFANTTTRPGRDDRGCAGRRPNLYRLANLLAVAAELCREQYSRRAVAWTVTCLELESTAAERLGGA